MNEKTHSVSSISEACIGFNTINKIKAEIKAKKKAELKRLLELEMERQRVIVEA